MCWSAGLMPSVLRCRAACDRCRTPNVRTADGNNARSVQPADRLSSALALAKQRRLYPFNRSTERKKHKAIHVALRRTIHTEPESSKAHRMSQKERKRRRFQTFFFFDSLFPRFIFLLSYSVLCRLFFSTPSPLFLLLAFSFASLVCFVFDDVRVGKCFTNSSKCTQETVYSRYRYDAVVQKDFIYSVSCRSLCLFVCCCLLMHFMINFFLIFFAQFELKRKTIATEKYYKVNILCANTCEWRKYVRRNSCGKLLSRRKSLENKWSRVCIRIHKLKFRFMLTANYDKVFERLTLKRNRLRK